MHRPRPGRIAALSLAILASACPSKKSEPTPPPLHVASPAWEDQVIYFVMTDRFANGDPSNDDQGAGEYDPANLEKFSGGDLKGLTARLDYVQGLGATAVWITPPVANMWWDPVYAAAGYHGYWARDLEKVDEHLGTLDDYRALSQALHGRGMYLVQDVVPNHMGNFFKLTDTPPVACSPDVYDPTRFSRNLLAKPTTAPVAPFDQVDATDPAQRAASIYHWTPPISNYGDACQEVNYQISDLDDLDTENPVVRKALRKSYAYWIQEVGVDAFRVDTAKFVPHAFWNDFFHGTTDADAPGILAAARATGRDDFLAFGEVYEIPLEGEDAADHKVASYLGTPAAPELPSVLQFPLYGEIKRVFANGRPTEDMTYRLARFLDPTLFPDPGRIPTFIDNHDVERFLSIGTDAALAQALAFLFTMPGIPVVYQGTEQGFTVTRQAMFAGGYGSTADHFDTTAPGYLRIQKLAALRKAHRALTRGTTEVLTDAPAGAGVLAYKRVSGDDTVLVFMNTADEPVLLSGLPSGLAPGTQLELLYFENAGYTPTPPKVVEGGYFQAQLPARAVVVARPTRTVVTPPPPPATLVLATPVQGQTFTTDVTLSGSVTPSNIPVFLVVDGYVNRSTPIHVDVDTGAWSVVLPVSVFPVGTQQHTVAVYAQYQKVATPTYRFTSEVVFEGEIYSVDDPAGDDHGAAGTYAYPTDLTFLRQMDLRNVTAEVGVTTLTLKLQMADMTTSWTPTYGFDHVSFGIYFMLPGQPGGTQLPAAAGADQALNASTPAGFTWTLAQFGTGWTNGMYGYDAANPTLFGPALATPEVKANAPSKTVSYTYDRTRYGLASWSGVKIWVATWDFDGIKGNFRRIFPAAPAYDMGGGTVNCDPNPDPDENKGCEDPKVMDGSEVLVIP